MPGITRVVPGNAPKSMSAGCVVMITKRPVVKTKTKSSDYVQVVVWWMMLFIMKLHVIRLLHFHQQRRSKMLVRFFMFVYVMVLLLLGPQRRSMILVKFPSKHHCFSDTVRPAASVEFAHDDSFLVDSDNSLAATVCLNDDVNPCEFDCIGSLTASVYQVQPECLRLVSDQIAHVNGRTLRDDGSLGGRHGERAPGLEDMVSPEGYISDVCSSNCTQVGAGLCDVQVDSPPIVPCPISLRLYKFSRMGCACIQLNPETWYYYLQHEDNVKLRDYLW